MKDLRPGWEQGPRHNALVAKHQTDPSVLCPHPIGKELEHSPWNTADVENQDSCIWFLNRRGELRRQGLLLSPSWTRLPHPPPTHKGNSSEDHRALKTQQEGQSHFLSKAKGSRDTEGAGLLQSLSRIWRREASYLAAMRKDDHHKAVQGTVVTVCHLHQSCDHFLQGKATVKAGAPMESCLAGSSQRPQHSTLLPVLKLGRTRPTYWHHLEEKVRCLVTGHLIPTITLWGQLLLCLNWETEA